MIPCISLGATLATLVSRVVPDLYIVVIYFVILTGVLIFNLDRLKDIIKKETGLKPPAAPVQVNHVDTVSENAAKPLETEPQDDEPKVKPVEVAPDKSPVTTVEQPAISKRTERIEEQKHLGIQAFNPLVSMTP